MVGRGGAMPLYEYTARDVTGKVLAGAIEAESDATVTQKLREMGFFITNLQRKSAPVGVGRCSARFKASAFKNLPVFARSFSTLSTAVLRLVGRLAIPQDRP